MDDGELFQVNGIWYRHYDFWDERGHKYQVSFQSSTRGGVSNGRP